jgi:hypothetical protein
LIDSKFNNLKSFFLYRSCLADYDLIRCEGNHRHERTCQHHDANLNTLEPVNNRLLDEVDIDVFTRLTQRFRTQTVAA